MNPLSTRGTMYVAMWIKHNGYEREFSKAKDLKEFKQLVKVKLFGNDRPDEKFVKGAQLISWEALFRAIKS